MLEAQNLTKDYGSLRAVDRVSFEVQKGSVVGFLGPNGAGKTTTLRLLTGVLGPTSGDTLVCGISMLSKPEAAKARIGYMPENSPLYPELRVCEYLKFRASLLGAMGSDRDRRVDRCAAQAGAWDVLGIPCGELSKGYRQRVTLAAALLGDPPVLVLDEPTSGLDPNQVRELRALVRELRSDRAVLLSTHVLPELEALCDDVVVLAGGWVVAGGADALRRGGGHATVRLHVSGDLNVARAILEQHPSTASIALDTDSTKSGFLIRLHEEAVPGDALESMIASLVQAGCGVRLAQSEPAALEDVFQSLTREEPT